MSNFLPDRLGQLVTSLSDDDIKEILYHAIPNMWKKKMVEQGYNYLNGPIHSITEFFETRIENLEKSIPLSVPSRNKKKSKKGSKKRKSVTFRVHTNKFNSRKPSTNKWSMMDGSFLTLCKAEVKIKLPKLNFNAHAFALFQVTIYAQAAFPKRNVCLIKDEESLQ